MLMGAPDRVTTTKDPRYPTRPRRRRPEAMKRRLGRVVVTRAERAPLFAIPSRKECEDSEIHLLVLIADKEGCYKKVCQKILLC